MKNPKSLLNQPAYCSCVREEAGNVQAVDVGACVTRCIISIAMYMNRAQYMYCLLLTHRSTTNPIQHSNLHEICLKPLILRNYLTDGKIFTSYRVALSIKPL